jgi:hypothetical protein
MHRAILTLALYELRLLFGLLADDPQATSTNAQPAAAAATGQREPLTRVVLRAGCV